MGDFILLGFVLVIVCTILRGINSIVKGEKYNNIHFLADLIDGGNSEFYTESGKLVRLRKVEPSRIINRGVTMEIVDREEVIDSYKFCIGFGMRSEYTSYSRLVRKDIERSLKRLYKTKKRG